MKLLYLFLTLLGFCNLCCAQFNFGEQDAPDTFTGTLLDVSFVDEFTGFAVGSAGTVIRTIDGGVTWTYLDSPTVEWLNSITFLDENVGYIAGNNGALFRTINGGIDWEAISPVTIVSTDDLQDVYFYDYNVGVIGGNASMAYTTDGGDSWNASLVPVSGGSVVEFDFATVDSGAVILASNDLYFTTDGGENWMDAGVASLTFEPRGLEVISTKHVIIAGGYGDVIYSIDDTWFTGSVPFSESFYGVDFLDENHGLIVGSNHCILKTEDGGANWSDVGFFISGEFLAVDYITDFTATVVGSNAKIYRSPIGSDIEFESYSGIDQVCENSMVDVVFEVKNNGPQAVNGGAFTITGYGGLPLVYPWTGVLYPGESTTINAGAITVNASTSVDIAFSGDTEVLNNTFSHYIDVFAKDPAGSSGPYTQCPNGSTGIEVYGGLSYLWLNLDNPVDSSAASQVVQSDSTTTYFVVINQSNCSFIEPVVVHVATSGTNCITSQDFAFSPNGDGLNDFFFFEGIPDGNNVFRVFDRWGGKVNEVDNYDNDISVWDGTNLTNQPVLPGTYFYTLEIIDTGYKQSGWIQVVK